MKRTLEYVPPLIAFLAVLMGISSTPKWNSAGAGFYRVTWFGWATATVGLAALVASVLITRKRQKDLEVQSLQREHLRRIAHSDIRLALRQITWPFFSLFGDDTEGSEIELVPAPIEDKKRLTDVMKIELRSKSPGLSRSTFTVPWAEVLKENADRGTTRLDRAMQIYASYLEPNVLEALSDVRTSGFLVLRLQRLDELVDMNQHVAFLEFPFVNAPDMSDCFGYGQFWAMLRKLDLQLYKDATRLRRRL